MEKNKNKIVTQPRNEAVSVQCVWFNAVKQEREQKRADYKKQTYEQMNHKLYTHQHHAFDI